MSISKTTMVVVVALAAMVLVGAVSVNVPIGNCSGILDITAGTEEFWIKAGGRNIQYQLEPDDTGANTGVLVNVFVCTENSNDDSCAAYLWDSDGDGVLDTSTLDGITAGRRGNQAIGIAGYMKFVATAATTGKTAQLIVCALAN